jgi:cytochrome c553
MIIKKMETTMNLKNFGLTAGALALILGALPAMAADKAELAKAEEIVVGRCSLCHGLQGESASPIFPRLAGQHADYINKQLNDFKSGKRVSETMKPQTDSLTPEEMKALGVFFEAKKVGARASRDAELLGVGKYVFNRGNQFSGVPACSSCHGAKGLGTPQLPRLAGQHPRYVEDQLKQFNTRARHNDNEVMHMVASKLSELERNAVAEYIATLD